MAWASAEFCTIFFTPVLVVAIESKYEILFGWFLILFYELGSSSS